MVTWTWWMPEKKKRKADEKKDKNKDKEKCLFYKKSKAQQLNSNGGKK